MAHPSDQDANATRVHIFGQTLTVRGAADEAYVQSLATYVTTHMERLAKGAPLIPITQVAMLAAVNIAHELFALRADTTRDQDDWSHRAEALLADIEQQLPTAQPIAQTDTRTDARTDN